MEYPVHTGYSAQTAARLQGGVTPKQRPEVHGVSGPRAEKQNDINRGSGYYTYERVGGFKMRTTELFCLKKDNLFVSADGKTMTNRLSKAGLFSKTICRRKYPGYEMIASSELCSE
jgi:hypothetical protein